MCIKVICGIFLFTFPINSLIKVYYHKFYLFGRTNKIISLFPQYQVEISGVGVPPKGEESVGHCSQLALFTRSKDYSPNPDKVMCVFSIQSSVGPWRISMRKY